MNIYKQLSLYIVSGLLLGTSLIFTEVWWLVIIGVSVFVFALAKTNTLLIASLGGFISWSIKMLFATSYIISVYPIRWIDTGMGVLELPLILVYWISSALSIGVVGLFFGYLTMSLWRYSQKLLLCLLPLLFVAFEIAGSFFYSLIMYGEGSFIGVTNSGGYIGYALAQHSFLIQFAKFGGVFILTFLASSIGVAIYVMARYMPVTRALIAGVVFIFIISLSKDLYTPQKNTATLGLKVAVVDTYFGNDDFYKETKTGQERFLLQETELEKALWVALVSDADYIIFSEDSQIINPDIPLSIGYNLFRFSYGDPDTVVMFAGTVTNKNNDAYTANLRYFIYDGKTKKPFAIDKQKLVPMGEYMPALYNFILKYSGLSKHNKFLSDSVSIYRPGQYNSQKEFSAYIPSVLFCFETLDPFASKKLASERNVNFIVHPISHTWFDNSHILQRQLDAVLLVQSLWSNKDIISSGNAVPGAVYTKQGQKIIPESIGENKWWRVGVITI